MRMMIAAIFALSPIMPAIAAEEPEAIDLPGDRLFPENLSIGADGVAYVSGMSGAILRVSLDTGEVEQWIAPGTFGIGALFGVLVDERNGMLWTCTNDFSARGVSVAGADPGTWIKGFDLATREGRISMKLPGDSGICNDMAVGKSGAVYFSDTALPRILRWKPGTTALEVWTEDPSMAGGLDGLAFGGDGNLYINNVRTGALFRVNVDASEEAGAVTQLATSRPLASPDGMRPLGDMKFALAEGAGRISVLDVTGDTVEVTTLAENITQPTGVEAANGTIWYVQGHVSSLFNPNGPQPTLPFRLTPVAGR